MFYHLVASGLWTENTNQMKYYICYFDYIYKIGFRNMSKLRYKDTSRQCYNLTVEGLRDKHPGQFERPLMFEIGLVYIHQNQSNLVSFLTHLFPWWKSWLGLCRWRLYAYLILGRFFPILVVIGDITTYLQT